MKQSKNHVEIRNTTFEDIPKLRAMHAKSWRETYPNEENGVSKQWVEERTARWTTPEGIKKNQEHFKDVIGHPDHLHLVAVVNDDIIGLVHASKTDIGQHLNAIYIDKKYYGTGLAGQLMEKALAWYDLSQPIDLEVAIYNERAKAFYRKYGFEEKSGSEHAFADVIPVITMERTGAKDKGKEYRIERLQPKDVEAMAALHTQVWLETFTNKTFGLDQKWAEKRMKEKYSASEIARIKQLTLEDQETTERIWFVAKDNKGKIIGMARPYRRDEEGLQRVGAIYVDKKYQGKGIADALMNEVVQWSRPDEALYLWVAVKNERAKHFYEKWGFKVVEGKESIVYGKVPHIQMVRKGEVI